MKYRVKITQIREGYAEIEAETAQQALQEADRMYNAEGRDLPDMDDVGALKIRLDEVPTQNQSVAKPSGPLTEEEVVAYLKKNGWPQPESSQISWLLDTEGFRQKCCAEAVRNNYNMPDVDRWFHLQNVLQADFSFAAAMFVDNSLWEEDLEILECNCKEHFLESDLLKSRLEALAQEYNDHGDAGLVKTGWSISVQDLSMLISSLGLQDIIELLPTNTPANAHETEEPGRPPEAQVYIRAGSVKELLFEGPYETCLDFCKNENWVHKDANEFVWGLELEDLRDLHMNFPSKNEIESILGNPDYKDIDTETLIQMSKEAFGEYYAAATMPVGDYHPQMKFTTLEEATEKYEAIREELERRQKQNASNEAKEAPRTGPVYSSFHDLAIALNNAAAIEYKGIVFDNWEVDKEYESVWGEMCQDCADKYKDTLDNELELGGCGSCSVMGCNVVGADTDNERHYYVDFKPEHIQVLTKELLAERHPELVAPEGRKPTLIAQIASAENRNPVADHNWSPMQREQKNANEPEK